MKRLTDITIGDYHDTIYQLKSGQLIRVRLTEDSYGSETFHSVAEVEAQTVTKTEYKEL